MSMQSIRSNRSLRAIRTGRIDATWTPSQSIPEPSAALTRAMDRDFTHSLPPRCISAWVDDFGVLRREVYPQSAKPVPVRKRRSVQAYQLAAARGLFDQYDNALLGFDLPAKPGTLKTLTLRRDGAGHVSEVRYE